MSVLNKESAKKIARKLKATIDTSNKAHDQAIIYVHGVEVASFGIRRGKKDLGHDYIPENIYVSPREAKMLASCPMTRQQWVAKMIERGVIPRPSEENVN